MSCTGTCHQGRAACNCEHGFPLVAAVAANDDSAREPVRARLPDWVIAAIFLGAVAMVVSPGLREFVKRQLLLVL